MRKTIKQKATQILLIFFVRHTNYFDEKWYRAKCPAPPLPHENAIHHYLNGGWKMCDPSPVFSNKQYLEKNPDVATSHMCPLAHYLLFGKREGRQIAPYDRNVYQAGKYYRFGWLRTIRRSFASLQHSRLINQNKHARILVCLQMYYPHSWKEINEYIKNLSPYSFDLVVTYQDFYGFDSVVKEIKKSYPQVLLLKVDNIGFDIGAFYASLNLIDLSKYDIVFKLHSKGVTRKHLYMYKQLFIKRDWFLYLFEGVIGAKNVHIVVDRLLNDPCCGLMAAKNLLANDPRHKQALLRTRLEERNLDIVIPENYTFVAGTCFATKAGLLSQFRDLQLDFEPSKRRVFSLAHCMERVLCFPAQQNEMYIAGTKACCFKIILRKIRARRYRNTVTEQLLADDRFILDDEYVYTGLETRKIVSYKLISLKIGEIKRRWFDGNIYSLKECAPYKYLVTRDATIYQEYSKYHLSRDLPLMTQERYQTLIDSIQKTGYNEKKVIVVNQDNIILDGLHRASCLLYIHGEDYKINVLKITM